MIEIAGALAFGSICFYDYFTCKEHAEEDRESLRCTRTGIFITEHSESLDGVECFTFLSNAITAAGYAGFLIYVKTIAWLYYRYCVRTGDMDLFLEQAAKMATPLVAES